MIGRNPKQQGAAPPVTTTSRCTATRETSQLIIDARHHNEKKTMKLPVIPSVTFFEMITPPHQLNRSQSADFDPRVKHSKPQIIAIIEENAPTSPQVNHKSLSTISFQEDDDSSFSSSTSSISSTSNFIGRLSATMEDDGSDKLDGSLLPDFFTYTSAEREFIRQYQPVFFQSQRKPLNRGKISEITCFWAM